MARCTLNQKYLANSKSFTKFRGAWLQMQNLMKIMTIPPKKNDISEGHMSQLALPSVSNEGIQVQIPQTPLKLLNYQKKYINFFH